MKQYIRHGYIANLENIISKGMEFVSIYKYHHSEIITYGKVHEFVTIILHYEIS